MQKTCGTARFTVEVANPLTHWFRVSLALSGCQHGKAVRLRMPAWIPGSYMIRDFSRHIVDIGASSGGCTLQLHKAGKSQWRLIPVGDEVTVQYTVYAYDLSVRKAWLDQQFGFFNGTSVFFELLDDETDTALDCDYEMILAPPAFSVESDWSVATSMQPQSIDQLGFGRYRAESYADLIDHPVLIGDLQRGRFDVLGVEHQLVFSESTATDLQRICIDLERICRYQIELFGKPAPFDHYQFLTMLSARGYGGLEHRFSTALLFSRRDLPASHDHEIGDGYLKFLGLCSHEYFHTWHVKRIRPAVLAAATLQSEAHTRTLWAFEGITSYYDDLTLIRCGLIDSDRYLKLIETTINRVLGAPGHSCQSVAASSYDAWTRFYQVDENTPNAVVSYYAKGSLIALCLDLWLRQCTDHAVTLDEVMRKLWRDYGLTDRPLGEHEIEDVIASMLNTADGEAARAFLHQALETTQPLPLAELLESVGVKLQFEPLERKDLSFQRVLQLEGSVQPQGFKVSRVINGGIGQQLGVAAGDLVIAVNGERVSSDSLKDWCYRLADGDALTVHAFHDDRLQQFDGTCTPLPGSWKLIPGQHTGGDEADRVRVNQARWLGQLPGDGDD